jgi:rubrerythrin
MSKTEKNLQEAFAGESQANRKYLAYAEKAEKDGYSSAAKLFRAAAEAETIHAHAHFRLMKGIGDTRQNLEHAVSGETHEYKSMYPAFVADAANENETAAKRIFEYALEAERVHAELYAEMLDNLDKKEEAEFYLCPVCGYIAKNALPDNCPICQAKASVFKKIV